MLRYREGHADALRGMNLVWIDCGTRDEYALHPGARILVKRLRDRGVAVVHEEFDGGHMGITTVRNSILSGPSPICQNLTTPIGGPNAITDMSCGTGPGHIQADPLLGPLQQNGGPTLTQAPLTGSPAIGATPICLPTDQRGASRAARCDIGAVEAGAAPVLTDLAPANAPAGGLSFSVTVTGTGFLPDTVVLWNGQPRLTEAIGPTTLRALISSSDLAAVGPATVQVRYGESAAVSNGLPFAVFAASPRIVIVPIAFKAAGG